MTCGYEKLRNLKLRAIKLSRFTAKFYIAAKLQNN